MLVPHVGETAWLAEREQFSRLLNVAGIAPGGEWLLDVPPRTRGGTGGDARSGRRRDRRPSRGRGATSRAQPERTAATGDQVLTQCVDIDIAVIGARRGGDSRHDHGGLDFAA
jgi:hypothetical protein